MPKISCIMTTYNSEEYLKLSIESILNQTFKDFEFIISEGGSTDNTKNIIKEYAKNDKRIKFIDNDKNLTNCECLNQCLEIAEGDLITIMESDDISTPDRFQICYDCFEEKKDMEIIYPTFIYFSDKDNIKSYLNQKNTQKPIYKKNISEQEGVFGNLGWTGCALIRKSVLNKLGNFQYRYVWDTYFTQKIFLEGINYYNIDKVVYLKRDNANSLGCRKKIRVRKDRYVSHMNLFKKYSVSSKTKINTIVKLYMDLLYIIIIKTLYEGYLKRGNKTEK